MAAPPIVSSSVSLVLQPGRVEQQLLALLTNSENGLRVVLTTDKRSGERGIMLGGQFVPASIPSAFKDGESLLVKPELRSDALILKIVPQRIETAQSTLTSTIADELRELFDQATLSDLRSAASSQPNPNLQLSRANSSLSASIAAQIEQGSKEASEAVLLLQTAIDRSHTLTDSAAKDPEALTKLLTSLVIKPDPNPVQDGRKALEQLVQSLPSVKLVSVSNAIRDALSEILQSKRPLSFLPQETPPPAGDPSQVAGQDQTGSDLPTTYAPAPDRARLLLSMVNYVVATDLTPAATIRTLMTPEIRNNPLLAILFGLQNLPEQNVDHSPTADRVLVQHLALLASDLRRLKDASSSDKEIREALGRARANLSSTLAAESPSSERAQDAALKANILKSIESTLSAQEALATLNPIFTALGEPALVLIPTFFSGLFGRWFATITNQEHEIGDEQGEGREHSSQYKTIELAVTLPSLGDVDVRMSLRSTDLYIHAGIANDEARSFIEARLPGLEPKLSALGFTSVSLTVGQRTHRIEPPQWVSEVTRTSRVA